MGEEGKAFFDCRSECLRLGKAFFDYRSECLGAGGGEGKRWLG